MIDPFQLKTPHKKNETMVNIGNFDIIGTIDGVFQIRVMGLIMINTKHIEIKKYNLAVT